MSIMKKYGIWFLLLCVIVVQSCRQDKEISTETVIITNEPVVRINTSITGMISDESGQPIQGVLVEVESFSASTDDNGFFYLKDIEANEKGASVKATKAGFFTTSKLVYPELGSVEFVKITLLESDEGGMFNAPSGGQVQLTSGVLLDFPANAVEKDGAPYTGSVSVHATYIDPLARDLDDRMPGSLIGINDEGALQGMETYGMVGVDLYDEAGELLEVASNKKVKIHFPLPTDLQGSAPSSIDLWHFDENSAYWVQEGQARLESNQYIAEVSHFSFWNCDAPFDLVNVRGRVLTTDDKEVSGTRVEIERKGSTARGTGSAYTDYRGYFRGKIPANEFLELRVYDICGDLAFTQDIGPFNSDADVGVITVDYPNELVVSGVLVDCNGDNVNDGYAMITINGVNTPGLVDADGRFEVVIGACGMEEISITPFDLAAQQKGDISSYRFSSPLDVGTLSACGNVVYTLNLNIDGTPISIENCFGYTFLDSMRSSEEILYIGAEAGRGYGNMYIEGNTVGSFPVLLFDFNLLDFPNTVFEQPNINCVVTQLDPAPSIIRGSFSGTAINSSTGMTVDIFGDFNAERN